MSRRRPRDAQRRDRGAQPRAEDRQPRDSGAGRPHRGGIARDVVILAGAFGLGGGGAVLFGAANLGVAVGVGQVVFARVLVVLLIRD